MYPVSRFEHSNQAELIQVSKSYYRLPSSSKMSLIEIIIVDLQRIKMKSTAIPTLILAAICLINVAEGHKMTHMKSTVQYHSLPYQPIYYAPSYYVPAPAYYFVPASSPATSSYAVPRVAPSSARPSYSSPNMY